MYHIYYNKAGKKKISRHSKGLDLSLGLKAKEGHDTEWKDLYGNGVHDISFPTLKDFYSFDREYSQYEDVYGKIAPEYQFISNNYPGELKFDHSNIKTFIVDIETLSVKYNDHKFLMVGLDEETAENLTYEDLENKFTGEEKEKLIYQTKGGEWRPYNRSIYVKHAGFPDPQEVKYPIISIAIKNKKSGMYYVCGTKDYEENETILEIPKESIEYHKAENEEGIFEWFIQKMVKEKPDILVGWYSENFDWPYIINRSEKVFGSLDKLKRISPFRHIKCEYSEFSDNAYSGSYKIEVGGIYMLDYLKIYKKFTFEPRESYSLNFISDAELESQKLDYEEYGNLNDLWKENYQLFIDYNIYDVELISMLDDKLKLLDTMLILAYKAKCNIHDVLGTIKIWDVYIYNVLKDMKIFIPAMKENEKVKYAGGHVKEPITDIYSWLLSFDLNSLYPFIQWQFNISPECIIDGKFENVCLDEIDPDILHQKIKPDPNYILAGNGQYFDGEKKGIIPTILMAIYDERSQVKKEMLRKKQELVDLQEKIKKELDK